MNLFGFSVADCLKKAAEADGTKQDSVWSDDIRKSFQDTLAGFPTVAKCCKESFNWEPNMVPVFCAEINEEEAIEEGIEAKTEYYVELDQVAKLANSKKTGIAEAFYMVQNYIEEEVGAEAANETYLVIENVGDMLVQESEDAIGSRLEDIKLNGLKGTTEILQELSAKAVPIKIK